MLYYLGKGTQFRKEGCKEYKTIEGALRAAAKDKAFAVWDENGHLVEMVAATAGAGGQKAAGEGEETAADGRNGNGIPETENAENGANTEPEKSGQDSGNSDGQQVGQKAAREGTETAADGRNGAEPENGIPETRNAENGANTEPEEREIIIPQGTMRVTVICDGTLNLRRSADWGNGNICGRASRGQSYYVKAIQTVQGKKMVQTIDDIYLSGQSEHVRYFSWGGEIGHYNKGLS